MHVLLAAALEQTVQQIAALEAGDDDLFLERAPAHEAACLLVAGLPAEVLAGEAAALVTLIEANARMDAAIAARQDDAAHRLAALAARRQANSAYGAAILESSYPTHQV